MIDNQIKHFIYYNNNIYIFKIRKINKYNI
jgi:hypothetical protein